MDRTLRDDAAEVLLVDEEDDEEECTGSDAERKSQNCMVEFRDIPTKRPLRSSSSLARIELSLN